MALWEDRGRARRAELEQLVPGDGFMARLDRGAWSALSQGAPGTWSWPKTAATVVLGAVAALIVYLTIYRDVAWVVGLGIAYAILFWRARVVHAEYLRRTGAA